MSLLDERLPAETRGAVGPDLGLRRRRPAAARSPADRAAPGAPARARGARGAPGLRSLGAAHAARAAALRERTPARAARTGPNFAEGVAAFLQKRAPSFPGREVMIERTLFTARPRGLPRQLPPLHGQGDRALPRGLGRAGLRGPRGLEQGRRQRLPVHGAARGIRRRGRRPALFGDPVRGALGARLHRHRLRAAQRDRGALHPALRHRGAEDSTTCRSSRAAR